MGSSLEPFMIDAAVTAATAKVWRLLLPAAGGQVAFSRPSSHGLRAGPFYRFYDQGGSPGRLPLLFCPQYTSSDSKSDYATDASQWVAGFSSLAFLQDYGPLHFINSGSTYSTFSPFQIISFPTFRYYATFQCSHSLAIFDLQ